MNQERIPLFPLNVVLFPGMMLPLHIFEERYKVMVARCLAEGARFGVVLIRTGSEVGGSPQTYDVGTIARIIKAARYEDGRMDILTIGTQRFRILQSYDDLPYRQGDIEIIDDLREQPPSEAYLAEIIQLLHEYRQLLAGSEPGRFKPPEDAEQLSYVAGTLDIELSRKQELLAMTSVRHRLDRLRDILREEIRLLRTLGATRPTRGPGQISLN